MNELRPEISTGRRFNPIWVVPVVALVIGLYMVIHTRLTEGPEITVTFNTAEGLESGKTKIRYRDVDIGLVENVSLSDSMDNVLVTAKMDRKAAGLLVEDTRFWVVRARVGAGSISGLGTILSGAYIQLDPGAGKRRTEEFTGLEVPPLTPADAPGIRLTLQTDAAGSLNAGDPILYNGYKVGRIEAATFDSEKKEMRYDAFVDAPYDSLVTTNSRFWDASGVSIEATAAGLQVRTGSLETILLGGVAFGNLPGQVPGEKAASGSTFKLAASYSELEQHPYKHRIYMVAQFQQSLRGLEPGAPVEYRGIQIGQVERILVKELATEGKPGEGRPIPVLIYLEPGRMQAGDTEAAVEFISESVRRGIVKGMRASLQTGNLITGKLFINIDYYPDATPVTLAQFDGYTVLPTIPSGLGRLEQRVGDLLDKLNGLPLDSLIASADTALVALDGTLDSLREILEESSTRALPGELNQSLAELRKAIDGLSPDSAVGQSLSDSVFELNRTLRNLESLTRTLSEEPNLLVFPRDNPADPAPEARP